MKPVCIVTGSGGLIGSESVTYFVSQVAAVYNLGGGRASNVSMLEAIAKCQEIAGRELDYALADEARMGDHRWWISDLSEFQRDYPGFELSYGIDEVLQEIYDANVEQWSAEALRV